MSRSWAGGSTTAWRKLRAQILARDEGRCRLVVEGVCTGHATHVHHTLGKKVTGDDPRYLVAACAACNLHIGEPKPDPPPRPSTRW